MKKIPLLFMTMFCCSALVFADNKSTDADNTERNRQDQEAEKKTPFDQSESPEDVELTASIRKMVVEDGDLSTLAKNVKIITNAGNVVLRGPVESESEKQAIVKYASAAGARNILNEIEVKQP